MQNKKDPRIFGHAHVFEGDKYPTCEICGLLKSTIESCYPESLTNNQLKELKKRHPVMYRIWSIEHNGWWAPSECGYRQKIEEAGLYEFDHAIRIVTGANKYTKNKPNEAIVPAE